MPPHDSRVQGAFFILGQLRGFANSTAHPALVQAEVQLRQLVRAWLKEGLVSVTTH